jgi:uncharacterized membrane protein
MSKRAKSKQAVRHRTSYHNQNVTALRLKYRFLILFGVLVLAGIAIVLQTESPSVWTFLYGIGGWAALTTQNIPKA